VLPCSLKRASLKNRLQASDLRLQVPGFQSPVPFFASPGSAFFFSRGPGLPAGRQVPQFSFPGFRIPNTWSACRQAGSAFPDYRLSAARDHSIWDRFLLACRADFRDNRVFGIVRFPAGFHRFG
jgi:hypothetical protein